MREITIEQWKELIHAKAGVYFLYFYTPMCGTCQLAGKMLEVVDATIVTQPIYKCNLNYFPDIAHNYQIESVPCLTIWKDGKIEEKVYAFQSVQYLYDIVKRYQYK